MTQARRSWCVTRRVGQSTENCKNSRPQLSVETAERKENCPWKLMIFYSKNADYFAIGGTFNLYAESFPHFLRDSWSKWCNHIERCRYILAEFLSSQSIKLIEYLEEREYLLRGILLYNTLVYINGILVYNVLVYINGILVYNVLVYINGILVYNILVYINGILVYNMLVYINGMLVYNILVHINGILVYNILVYINGILVYNILVYTVYNYTT